MVNLGPDVADLKRPSPFTMNVWAILQEIKTTIGKESNQKDIDYTNFKLSLDELVPEGYQFDSDDENALQIDESRISPSPTQIPEFQPPPTVSKRSVKRSSSQMFDDSSSCSSNILQPIVSIESSDDQPMNTADVSTTTFEALNLLQNESMPNAMANAANSFHSIVMPSTAQQVIIALHNKEHELRMEVLHQQLETAKFNRQTAEINKMIATRNLSVLASVPSGAQSEHQ